MKIRVSKLRRIIREAIADTMIAPTEAPAPSQASLKQGSHPAMRDTSGDKSNAVAKIVNAQLGDTSKTQEIQKYVSQLDPQEKLVKNAEQIAQDFMALQSGPSGPGQQQTVGNPTMKAGNYDQEQQAKRKQQSLFDKYSTPKDKFQ